MICGATALTVAAQTSKEFQCRTQHDMWCNAVVDVDSVVGEVFQCRTQHDMWCN